MSWCSKHLLPSSTLTQWLLWEQSGIGNSLYSEHETQHDDSLLQFELGKSYHQMIVLPLLRDPQRRLPSLCPLWYAGLLMRVQVSPWFIHCKFLDSYNVSDIQISMVPKNWLLSFYHSRGIRKYIQMIVALSLLSSLVIFSPYVCSQILSLLRWLVSLDPVW